jgi:phosphate transport system protein
MRPARSEFRHELEVINARVIEMLGMVVQDLGVATQALLKGRSEAAAVLADRERLIDAVYVEIESLAVREILLQAPVASDLRLLLTIVRVVPELERSHDLIVNIATRASVVPSSELPPRVTALAQEASDLASAMWSKAADAWAGRDRSAAAAESGLRDQMDELHATLSAEIASGQMAAPVAIEMALAARDYERLGAHAANITRRVAYLAGPAGGPTVEN